MSLLEIKPMLYTRQVKETVDFYTLVLGFTCTNFMKVGAGPRFPAMR